MKRHGAIVMVRDALAGTLVSEKIHLAFLEEDIWTVVDFKTDRELRKQLRYYKATGCYLFSRNCSRH